MFYSPFLRLKPDPRRNGDIFVTISSNLQQSEFEGVENLTALKELRI